MAHAPSAKKHIRSDAKKRAKNRMRKRAVATYEKKFIALLADNKVDEAKSILTIVFPAYDKAAKKGVIKRSTTDRKKSRLNLALNRAAK